MEPNDNFDRHAVLHLLLEIFAAVNFLERATIAVMQHLSNLRLPMIFERVSDEVTQLQAIRYIGFIAALSCAIPVVMFVMFGITTVIITFGGFLFIEGLLLAFGGVCMVVCIVALILVLSVLALTLGASYMLALKLGYAIKRFEPASNILRAIAPAVIKENVNGMSHAHQNSINY